MERGTPVVSVHGTTRRTPGEEARRLGDKDLEAPRGAVLAGDGDFVREARRWRHRMGGTIDDAWPLALLALDGLERTRTHMTEYVAPRAHGTGPGAQLVRDDLRRRRPWS